MPFLISISAHTYIFSVFPDLIVIILRQNAVIGVRSNSYHADFMYFFNHVFAFESSGFVRLALFEVSLHSLSARPTRLIEGS